MLKPEKNPGESPKIDSFTVLERVVLELVPQLPKTIDLFQLIDLKPWYLADSFRGQIEKNNIYVRKKDAEKYEKNKDYFFSNQLDYRKTFQAYIDSFGVKYYKNILFAYFQHFYVQLLIEYHFFSDESKKRLEENYITSEWSLSRWDKGETKASGDVFFAAILNLLKKDLCNLGFKEDRIRVLEFSWDSFLEDLKNDIIALGLADKETCFTGDADSGKINRVAIRTSLKFFELIQHEDLLFVNEFCEFVKDKEFFLHKKVSKKMAEFIENSYRKDLKYHGNFGDSEVDGDVLHKRVHRFLRDWFYVIALVEITAPTEWEAPDWIC